MDMSPRLKVASRHQGLPLDCYFSPVAPLLFMALLLSSVKMMLPRVPLVALQGGLQYS